MLHFLYLSNFQAVLNHGLGNLKKERHGSLRLKIKARKPILNKHLE